jgi:IclR family mhp operon transcriptional activator
MTDKSDGTQRGTIRALAVLRALNSHNGARVSDLSKVTGISRPSLYRILETLCAIGYVNKRPDEDRYHLTMLVRALSDGYDDEEWIRSVAMPFLSRLQQEIVWPVDLVTYHGDAMYVRDTTRRHSPLTLDRITVGVRMPMLLSASGRAYLAYCPDAERETILENLTHSTAPEDIVAKDRKLVDHLLRNTRRDGYGQRFGELVPETGGIAIPIKHDGRVLACIHVAFFARVTNPKDVASRHLKAMQNTAMQIESTLDSNASGNLTKAAGLRKPRGKSVRQGPASTK